MRHLHSGRKLGVDSSHRTALLRSLTLALIERDAIRTTTARAKELRWWAERVVTLAKRGNLSGRRHIIRLLGSNQTGDSGENRVRKAIERIYSELVPRFKTRPGGYTQILHLVDRRPGDNAEMVLMRYLPEAEEAAKGGKKAKGGEKKADSSKKSKAAAEAKGEKAPKKEAKKAKAEAKSDEAEDKAREGEEHESGAHEGKSAKTKKKDKDKD